MKNAIEYMKDHAEVMGSCNATTQPDTNREPKTTTSSHGPTFESRANRKTQNKSFKYRSNLTQISFKPSNNDTIECSRIFIRQITPTLILFPYKLFIFPDHSSPCKLLYYGCGTCVGGRSYSSTTDNLLDFYTIKTERHLQT